MTVNEVFEKSMSLMDERTENGVVDADAVVIYQQNTPYIIDSLQRELLLIGDIYSTHEISRKSIQPKMSVLEVTEHDDEDVSKESSEVCKAYYFEVDGPGTVYIEDYTTSWNTLATQVVPSTVESFTAYKGVLTPTSGATKTRIRFSGSYYYNFRNIALYSQSFEAEANVPNFGEYVKYEMPTDFSSTSQIIGEETNYGKLTDYKWEGQKDLYIPYSFSGNIRIVYRPVPTDITALTDELQIDDIVASTVLPFGLAREILATENAALSNYFGQRYEELKYTMRKPRAKGIQSRNDIYDASLSF